jgi:hypothetical protein
VHIYIYIYTVHCAGLLDLQNILLPDIRTSRQTEGHSFGDHLISESVRVTPSSVLEASIVRCSVSYDSCESMSYGSYREIRWDGVDWIDMAQDRDQWRALVNTALNLRIP